MEAGFKEKAITLRKQGFSYSEILKQVNVAKSTLSLWLRDVGLSKKQTQKLSEKKRLSALKGALARKTWRIESSKQIIEKSEKEIGQLSARELWIIGISLYWAEGSKEKENKPGSGVQFTNSDPAMVKLFLRWLQESCKIERERIYLEIYIHDTCKDKLPEVIQFWAKASGSHESTFKRIYFKKSKIKIHRQNIGISYYGILRIRIKGSSIFHRQIAGWVRGLIR